MRQLYIPAILAAILLLGAVLATVSVEKASTVHTGLENKQTNVECTETSSITPATVGGNVDFDLEVKTDTGGFRIISLFVNPADAMDDGADDDDEGLTMTNFTIDDKYVMEFSNVAMDGDEPDSDAARGAHALNSVFNTDPASGTSSLEVDIDFDIDTASDETNGVGSFTIAVCALVERGATLSLTPSPSTTP